MKKRKIIVITIIIFFLIITTIFIYLNSSYKAINVDKYLKSNNQVKVINENNTYIFDGVGEDTALIFYQGGKVENISYAPLLYNLASNGIDCYLVKMPFNLAIFNKDSANDILNKYKNDYNNWYIGGHSLGGVVASLYDNELITGYIFLASYPNKEIIKPILLIRGDKDGVLKLDGYNDSKKYWNDYQEIIIEGGNHANFGNYGKQKKDNKSTISRNKQQEITTKEIISFIKDNN